MDPDLIEIEMTLLRRKVLAYEFQLQTLQVRFEVIEKFVKDKNPDAFAGEADTVVDPELHPIKIDGGVLFPVM